jgi:serine/threonine protein kinase
LIHRDVKATNILLNSRLEAKIADFGLSKAFNRDNETHVSTNAVVGTLGYMDPEYVYPYTYAPKYIFSLSCSKYWVEQKCFCRYQTIGRPTTKSDVYSFGIVLLVLVTGKPPTLNNPQTMSISEWVQQRLGQGNIEGVVDVRMHGDHNINGIWKAADIALKCTAKTSTHRPTMTDVVEQLQECLKLEDDRDDGGTNNEFYTGINSDDLDLRYDGYTTNRSTNMSGNNTTFEIEHNYGRVPTMDTGPAAR